MNKRAYTIAIAGKGGSGKTTLSTLIIRYFLMSNKTPVLAVDADPNANLNELLGVKAGRTIISALDETMHRKGELPPGVTKERHLEYQLNEALVECDGFDLLLMGRTEGAGCYCYANNLLRMLLDRLIGNYPYVVMDNEAGMEHLSRRTTRNADMLLIVANPTIISLKSAKRIYGTVKELKLGIDNTFLLLNNVIPNSNISSEVLEDTELELLARIPYDEEIAGRSTEAKPLLDLEENSPAIKAVKEMMEKVWR